MAGNPLPTGFGPIRPASVCHWLRWRWRPATRRHRRAKTAPECKKLRQDDKGNKEALIEAPVMMELGANHTQS